MTELVNNQPDKQPKLRDRWQMLKTVSASVIALATAGEVATPALAESAAQKDPTVVKAMQDLNEIQTYLEGIAGHSPAAYEEDATIDGDKEKRWVITYPQIDKISGQTGYAHLVIYTDKETDKLVTAFVINGAPSKKFQQGEYFTSFGGFGYNPKDHNEVIVESVEPDETTGDLVNKTYIKTETGSTLNINNTVSKPTSDQAVDRQLNIFVKSAQQMANHVKTHKRIKFPQSTTKPKKPGSLTA